MRGRQSDCTCRQDEQLPLAPIDLILIAKTYQQVFHFSDGRQLGRNQDGAIVEHVFQVFGFRSGKEPKILRFFDIFE